MVDLQELNLVATLVTDLFCVNYNPPSSSKINPFATPLLYTPLSIEPTMKLKLVFHFGCTNVHYFMSKFQLPSLDGKGMGACQMFFRNIMTKSVNKQACFTGCAQTLSDETPQIDKIHQFRKIGIPFEPMMQFGCPLTFRMS